MKARLHSPVRSIARIFTAAAAVLLASTAVADGVPRPAATAIEAPAVDDQPADGPLLNKNQDAETQRLAVWNSPSMLAARAWLEDYFRSSSRYPPAEARAYVATLEKLDADALRLWLAQLDQSMQRTAQEQRDAEVDRFYRRARANAVQQQRAINLAKLSAAQAQRARYAQSQINAQQRFSESLFRARNASRDETLRTQLATQNLRTFQILTLLDIQELRADLRVSRGER